jgi:hypothetical protein
MVRVAIGVCAARESGLCHGQAAAILRHAFEIRLTDAGRVSLVQRARANLRGRVAVLANSVTGSVAAHAVSALVTHAIIGRATRLPVHEQTHSAHVAMQARADTLACGGANAPALEALLLATARRILRVQQAEAGAAIGPRFTIGRAEGEWAGAAPTWLRLAIELVLRARLDACRRDHFVGLWSRAAAHDERDESGQDPDAPRGD